GSASSRSSLPNLTSQLQPVLPFSGSIPIVNARAAVDCPLFGFDGSPGTSAPPATLGGYTMTAFGPDARTIGAEVTSVPDAAGTLRFSAPVTHLRVPSSWQTWSHGYTGDVYFSGESSDPSIEMLLPTGT